jgi:hypothetical protein
MEEIMEEHPQDKTKVRIYTNHFIVEGEIFMFSGIRMTDYIISAHEFIAITNACVLTIEERVMFRTDFLSIQKDKIVIIVPEAEVKPA